MRDPYLYPDTEVLKNLLGIRDSKKLQEAEGDYVTFRLSEIAEDDRMTGVFDFSALPDLSGYLRMGRKAPHHEY